MQVPGGPRQVAQIDESYASSNQVVPQYAPTNQSFTSNFSYSSQPIRMQTFAPQKSPKSGSDYGSRETTLGNATIYSQEGGQLNTGFVHQTPIHTLNGGHSSPVKQKSPTKSTNTTMSPSNQWTPCGNQRGYHGYHSDAETEETEASDDEYGIQYSCADMTEGTYARTPRRLQMPDTILDNIADDSTTSGSYVVDPTDLCNEIDELFFKDMVV